MGAHSRDSGALEARAAGLYRQGAFAAALILLRKAAATPGGSPWLPFYLSRCLFQLGEVHECLRVLRPLARSRDPAVRRTALQDIAIYIPGDKAASLADVLSARRRWVRNETRADPHTPLRHRRRSAPGRRIRVGYVSAFFHRRNWMKPVWRTLEAHDRGAFEIHLFLERGQPRRGHGYRPNPADRVHRIDGLTNDQAARRIRAAGIDILVDLNAYSYSGRLGLFLRRAAPIQVGWFNTFATSGIDAIDFAIADRVAVPPRERRSCSERILDVPGSYLAFAVPYRVPRIAHPPRTRSHHLTFGCLAPQYKITPEVISAFAALLRAAPTARLLLRNACLGHPSNRADIRARFARRGIPARRLTLEGPAEHRAFLKTYDRIDVALDTFPYSGGVTTMEALWQGVPVLTFAGDRWASRTTASILAAAGLGAWVLPTRAAFIRRAAALARSPRAALWLCGHRTALRRRLGASAACDVAGLCRGLESAYRKMIRPNGLRSR